MLFVPLVNIVFALILALDIARVFGKSSAFAVGLLLLPMIFFPLLGFDDSSYLGPDARPVMATA